MISDILDLISQFGEAATVAAIITGISGFLLNTITEKQRRAEQRKLNLDAISNALKVPKQNIRTQGEDLSSTKILSGKVSSNVFFGDDKFSLEKQEDSKFQTKLVEDLVTNYHQQALSQAKVQFLFSIFAATIGFIYILYASLHIDDANMLTAIKIIPGVIVDAIAALFFRQAEQTRQRATELYDRLRKDQQMQRAETIVESIEDESIKSAIKAQVALHMAGLSPKEIDIHSFIKKNDPIIQ